MADEKSEGVGSLLSYPSKIGTRFRTMALAWFVIAIIGHATVALLALNSVGVQLAEEGSRSIVGFTRDVAATIPLALIDFDGLPQTDLDRIYDTDLLSNIRKWYEEAITDLAKEEARGNDEEEKAKKRISTFQGAITRIDQRKKLLSKAVRSNDSKSQLNLVEAVGKNGIPYFVYRISSLLDKNFDNFLGASSNKSEERKLPIIFSQHESGISINGFFITELLWKLPLWLALFYFSVDVLLVAGRFGRILKRMLSRSIESKMSSGAT